LISARYASAGVVSVLRPILRNSGPRFRCTHVRTLTIIRHEKHMTFHRALTYDNSSPNR
jgi:hypothetical protein